MKPQALLPLEEARRAIEKISLERPDTENIHVLKALWRVSANDVIAPRNVPDTPRAAMDGYAVRSGDAKPRARLKVSLLDHIGKGLAKPVETGDELPPGSDAVVRKEATRPAGEGYIEVSVSVGPWENVFKPGEFVSSGMKLVDRGSVVTPFRLSLLLQAGVYSIRVYRLRATIIPVGSEIRPAASLGPGVPDAISPMIAGMLAPVFDTVITPPVPDDKDLFRRALEEALAYSDVVITVGGSSVGGSDIVKGIVASMGDLVVPGFGASVLKRGGLGVVDRKLVVMLPGQCVSAALALHETLYRAMASLTGRSFVRTVRLELAEGFRLRRRMPAAVLLGVDGGRAEVLEWGVGLCRELAKASAYTVIDPGEYKRGETVEANMLYPANLP